MAPIFRTESSAKRADSPRGSFCRQPTLSSVDLMEAATLSQVREGFRERFENIRSLLDAAKIPEAKRQWGLLANECYNHAIFYPEDRPSTRQLVQEFEPMIAKNGLNHSNLLFQILSTTAPDDRILFGC